MRFSRVLVSVVVLVAAASAAEIKVKVVDPNSAPVSGAQVILFEGDRTVALSSTSPDGTAEFQTAGQVTQVRVLAAGFAPQSVDLQKPPRGEITVHLHLAPVAQTVVVTATRSPVPSDEAGAAVASLDSGQLRTMQPVAASDAMRFVPGAVIETSGRRGGIASLFVRGGDSRYNKVIVDGVVVDEPGGTFDFGVVPLAEADRLEFVRGAHSTLYGSDAMTSVVQLWTRSGDTAVPELRFGADGGNFATAHGDLSLAGAHRQLDYNLFADQFNSGGQGVNDEYSNSLQGGNVGVALSRKVSLRVRARHSNAFSGVQGEWKFNGQPLEPPDDNQWQRQNNLLASAELTVTAPSGWQHRFTGFDYHHQRTNVNGDSPDRIFDSAFTTIAHMNRAAFEYEGNWLQRSWAQATVGYQFEDENSFVPPSPRDLRLNHAVYGQELLTLGRLSVAAGARFVHNATFGNKGVPRVAVGFQTLKGGEVFSGSRLRFAYATGIKEARPEEAAASGPLIIPNPNLKAEENRAFEAGFEQSLFAGKYAFSATYFNNLYRNQIDFAIFDFTTFLGGYVNIDESMAHGVELELKGRLSSRLSLNAAYNYTSTQILEQPFAFDPLHEPGRPLIRRPKHSGSLLFTYVGSRSGGNLGGSFIGRRPDSDFLIFNIDHAAGYARVDAGGWYAVTRRVTAYVNVENVLNHYYEEVVGYPALGANFRAGMRFRIGGE